MKVGSARLRWLVVTISALAIACGALRASAQPPLAERLPVVSESQLRVVMVAIQGCPFCLKFERQVAPEYETRKEGRMAPLVRVRLGSEALKEFAPVKVTPTFLVLKGDQELGRFSGYPGVDGFWIELNEILSQHRLLPNSQLGANP